MMTSFLLRSAKVSLLALGLIAGSAAIADGTASEYLWTPIVIANFGPLNLASGINDRDQVLVSNLDGSKLGVYRYGRFTPLPAPPAGYSYFTARGINNSGAIVGGAVSPTDPTHEQGFILTGSKFSFFSRPG